MTKIKGIKIELGGTEYVVPPLNLNALEELQEALASYAGGLDIKSVTTVKSAAHSALKRNYPEITIQEVGEFIDIGNMAEVMQAVMDVSGMKRKELELGESAAANQSQ